MHLSGKYNFHTTHPDGLVTLTSSPTDGISGKPRPRDLTHEQQQAAVDEHTFWIDRKHDREAYE